jgi:hypothetical protein
MARIYLSQQRLESWMNQGLLTVEGDRMKLKDGKVFRVSEAVYFLGVVGDEADPHQLVGKVKTTMQLAELGVEHYRDSALLGSVGYQVAEGVVGEAE